LFAQTREGIAQRHRRDTQLRGEGRLGGKLLTIRDQAQRNRQSDSLFNLVGASRRHERQDYAIYAGII
jgi:hypothetical protein